MHQMFPLYDLDDVDAAINEPKIVHFTAGPKPWERDCNMPSKEMWWYCLGKTDYSDYTIPRRSALRAARRTAGRVARRVRSGKDENN